ncbi:MAG: DUF3365 domain-containing protein [Saprospiraceae bacterium]|nr:DUF3365 domain-containing protein [Saprospiraceae bacterium]MCF8251899.1 DUF3365 domain-containing protein [Saprospiraceae bacterium]MCF8281608.1 DUF3365 domain-containing protein [Bacteroidales bacterium]MCF8313585.1 DUF3365 domain-containing protein [Saprospiraceae bacterium]MCF8442283.1 DUF3365 domain-containing protein [Saprospiraceae bacterium]
MKALSSVAILFMVLFLAQCTSDKSGGQQLTPDEEKAYLEKGKAIAESTFAALSGKLATAMEEGGVEGAVQYCNLAAMPLVDSLSKANNATIRRTSQKPRNPLDAPSEWEAEILAGFQQSTAKGEKAMPRLKILDNNKVAFAAPIILQPLCMKCHGTVGTDIAEADYAIIKKLYPKDEAVGYKPGELRGMWSIVFEQ